MPQSRARTPQPHTQSPATMACKSRRPAFQRAQEHPKPAAERTRRPGQPRLTDTRSAARRSARANRSTGADSPVAYPQRSRLSLSYCEHGVRGHDCGEGCDVNVPGQKVGTMCGRGHKMGLLREQMIRMRYRRRLPMIACGNLMAKAPITIVEPVDKPGGLTLEELCVLVGICKKEEPKSFFEFGSFRGRSA